ncbi:hypothetical protein K449DRAFT_440883 [Hypoxylon sp. EC38]|nr:hypothetical protein K449DRAFT_440883 [Hypoxylon sp. EC38]
MPPSQLNPEAPSWFPGRRTRYRRHPEPSIIRNAYVLVNAEIFGWHQVARRPLPSGAITNAIKELMAGLGLGNRVFGIQELRNIYANYTRNPHRRFDLSRPLDEAMESRSFAYSQLLGGVASLNRLRPLDVIELVAFVHNLNDLVKRILLAEYSGFFQQSFRSQSHELNGGIGHPLGPVYHAARGADLRQSLELLLRKLYFMLRLFYNLPWFVNFVCVVELDITRYILPKHHRQSREPCFMDSSEPDALGKYREWQPAPCELGLLAHAYLPRGAYIPVMEIAGAVRG